MCDTLTFATILTNHPVLRCCELGFIEACEALGYKYQIVGTETADVNEMNAAAEAAATTDTPAIMLFANDASCLSTISTLKNDYGIYVGVPHIHWDQEQAPGLDMCMACEPASYAESVAEFMAERLEGKTGSIAITQAAYNENEDIASAAFKKRVEELQAEGKLQGITVLEPAIEGAEDITESTNVNVSIIQANPDIVAAVSWCGSGPVTWSNAARKCGYQPGDLVIVSMDYTADNLAELEAGYVTALVAQPLYDQCYKIVENFDKLLRGETVEYWTELDAPLIYKGGEGAHDPATYTGNRQAFEDTVLLPQRGDSLDGFVDEFNGMLEGKISGSSASVEQERFLTVSVHKKNVDEARTFFSRVTGEVSSKLSRLNSSSNELDAAERLDVLRGFFRPEESSLPFDLQTAMKRGHNLKDTICPDSLEFHRDYFKMGSQYGRVLFLKDYASYIKDSMILELTDLNRRMMLSIDMIPVPTDEAVREVENKLLGVETNVTNWQRRQNSNQNFSAVVPYDLEQQRKETREMLDDLTTRDQRMLFAVVTLVHLADSKEELDSDTETLQSIARKHLCQLAKLSFQQQDGLITALPLGLRRIDALRTLTTEALAVLMPFKAQEIRHRHGIYYGQNAISKNLILADRKELLNGMEDHPYDELDMQEDMEAAMLQNWRNVLAVYAVKVSTDEEHGLDVMTMDEEKLQLLREIFFDANKLAHELTTSIVGGVQKTVLHISLQIKDAMQVADEYGFTSQQREMLEELLKPDYDDIFLSLIGNYQPDGTPIGPIDISDIQGTLPDDLDPLRETIVLTAYQLLRKVTYFWGGKSLVLGWDSRWGTPTTVTAPGSGSTGKVLPFGLDCSGFVDWTFYNATSGAYLPGRGGGAASQHGYCTNIAWSDALPGDLVFYADDSHVGIVCGYDSVGNLLVIHCSGGQNGVVVTGREGFAVAARPDLFTD